MKKILFFIVLVIFIFFVSCSSKKEEQNSAFREDYWYTSEHELAKGGSQKANGEQKYGIVFRSKDKKWYRVRIEFGDAEQRRAYDNKDLTTAFAGDPFSYEIDGNLIHTSRYTSQATVEIRETYLVMTYSKNTVYYYPTGVHVTITGRD